MRYERYQVVHPTWTREESCRFRENVSCMYTGFVDDSCGLQTRSADLPSDHPNLRMALHRGQRFIPAESRGAPYLNLDWDWDGSSERSYASLLLGYMNLCTQVGGGAIAFDAQGASPLMSPNREQPNLKLVIAEVDTMNVPGPLVHAVICDLFLASRVGRPLCTCGNRTLMSRCPSSDRTMGHGIEVYPRRGRYLLMKRRRGIPESSGLALHTIALSTS